MNIVFDLGGVVFNWQPDKIIKAVFNDTTRQNLVKKHIFEHPDWIELDRGTLSKEQAIERGALRCNLPESDIRRLLDTVPQALTPIQETIDLLFSIRDSDNKFYVLSNMHHETMAYLKRTNAIWEVFDGLVFSCLINKVKPEPEIYQHLINEFKLTPNETVFIDDMKENLIAASKLGIQTIHFKNAKQCHQALAALGCFE